MQLTVEQLVKQYKKVTAVNQLSFSVSRGEIFALLGPNGAGKSSLVKMLVGFTHPDAGRISLTDEEANYAKIPAYLLGYLPEDRGLYPEKSVKQNLWFFAQLHGVTKAEFEQRVSHWLAKFDLTERADEPLKSLSKGNQQKVQLITAVLHEPKWVILDEPFSGLDPINQEKVVAFLAELKAQGMTVILSAHQMAMVEKLADRVLLMNKGEAVLYGAMSDILKQADARVIDVTFAEPYQDDALLALIERFDVAKQSPVALSVTLPAGTALNELLPMLSQVGSIATLKNQQPSLHSIYLNSVASHEAHIEHTQNDNTSQGAVA